MGWGSGSILFSGIIDALQTEIPDEAKREAVYTRLIPVFEDEDWDTQRECRGQDPAFDRALKALHPRWHLPDQ